MPAALLSDWTAESRVFEEIGNLPSRLKDLLLMRSLVHVYPSERCDMYGFVAIRYGVVIDDFAWTDFDDDRMTLQTGYTEWLPCHSLRATETLFSFLRKDGLRESMNAKQVMRALQSLLT